MARFAGTARTTPPIPSRCPVSIAIVPAMPTIAHSNENILPRSNVLRVRHALLRWGCANAKNFPWRTPDERWHALVAEVLLQRTRAQSVVPVYEAFVDRFPTADHLVWATRQEIEALVRPLGLTWRATFLARLCGHLAEVGGRIPSDYDGLLALPGVGPYVASAVLAFHCGQRRAIVDANVVRWLCRLVGRPADGETRRKAWLIGLADDLTPARNWKPYNYAVLDFSMEVCAKQPKCQECPVGVALCVHGRQRLASEPGVGPGGL